jgi:hypothetical protein
MIRAGVYFLLVFGVGFAFGVVRTLWVVPYVGERLAELFEAPLMFVAIGFSARFVTRRFPASRSVDYLVSGGLALVLLLIVEFTVVLGLRGLSIDEYFAARDPVAGSVYGVMLIVFAVMPWILGKSRVTGAK